MGKHLETIKTYKLNCVWVNNWKQAKHTSWIVYG